MNELIANYTKIVIGLCALIVTVSYACGHLTTQDMVTLIPALLGGHALISGISSVLTGPTANKEITGGK
jgi:hypothetical protein